MNLKRDNWTNDEVIALLKDCKTPFACDDIGDENFALKEAINLFYDLKADASESYSAKALDVDTGRVVCVGLKLPQ